MAENDYDLIIVGAGWYGLIAATTYLQLAPDTRLLILDDGQSIGGVWNAERIYPNLFAQVGHGLFEYSFYPMKEEGLTPDRYISGQTIHDYLNSFAREFGLTPKIQLRTRVTKVEKLAGSPPGWQLSALLNGEKTTLQTSKLIVASGVSSGPYVPNFPRTNYRRLILHSSEIGSKLSEIRSEKVQRVVILGAAKSAYDTVFMMLKAGKKVDWIIREDGSGPLAIMPPRLLGLLNCVDIMATRALACFSPAILQTEGFWYWFLQRSSVGKMLTTMFWRNLTRVAEMHAGYSRSENAGRLRPIPFGFGVFWANSGLGLASVPNFWKTFHAGDVTVHRTSIKSFVDDNVCLENGQSLSADCVILCTGWTDNLDAFDASLRTKLGLPSAADFAGPWAELDAQADAEVDHLLPVLKTIPHDTPSEKHGTGSAHRPWRLYRRMVSPGMADAGDRSIFFPGQIHSVFTPLVAELQALWGTAFLLGDLPVPDIKPMQREVSLWNSWTKKRYLAQGRKHAYSIYDYLAYVDTLARDLGVKPNRKPNPIAEMFSTYRPRDYRGLIEEYLRVKQTAAARSSTAKLIMESSHRSISERTFDLLKYCYKYILLIVFAVIAISVV